MYRWLKFPFLRLLPTFIVGIQVAIHLWQINPSTGLIVSAMMVLGVLLIQHWTVLHKQNLQILKESLIYLIIFLLGNISLGIHRQDRNSGHYLNMEIDSVQAYVAIITQPSIHRKRSAKVGAEIINLNLGGNWYKTQGKIIIYHSLFDTLDYGQQILANAGIQEIPLPSNPGQFDYKEYMLSQNVFATSYVPDGKLLLINKYGGNLFVKFSYRLRNKCISIIDEYVLASRENAILKALLLGVKDDLDNDIRDSYSAAGAMHVLAVSGLHVGVIFLLFKLLMKKFRRRRFLFISSAVLGMLMLWIYAFVTGLSPSVLRATIMFSLVIFGEVLERRSSIYNTISLSAFIMLVFNPWLIMSVGFQLSYLAVAGIVYLQPRISKWFYSSNRLLRYAWECTSVSIAAQLVTFPLGLFYFHQFPTYFIISNLIVIPAAFAILSFGLASIIFELIIFTAISKVLMWVAAGVLYIMNECVFLIHSFPMSKLTLYIDLTQTWLIYAFIILLIATFTVKSFQLFKYAFVLSIIWAGYGLFRSYSIHQNNDLVFYDIPGHSAIDFIDGTSVKSYWDQELLENSEKADFFVSGFRLKNGLAGIDQHYDPVNMSSSNHFVICQWKEFTVLIPHEKIRINADLSQYGIDYILLRDNIHVHFEQANSISPLLILDHSNYSSYAAYLEKTAIANRWTVHNMHKKGALRINI